MFIYETIIIGAGAAGLFASCFADKHTLILEKQSSAGKKLLIAGSGRCNITNEGEIREFLENYYESSRFLRHTILTFTNKDLISFLYSIGLQTITDKNGKIFPATERSSDVLKVLLHKAEENGVQLRFEQAVKSVLKDNGIFIVETEKQKFYSKHLLIATGGITYPATGSTGDGYKLAKQLGHSIIEPRMALTPVFVNNFPFAENSGISFPGCTVFHFRNGKKIGSYQGDIGLTHRGISGPGIIDNSRYFEKGDELRLNLSGISTELLNRQILDQYCLDGSMLVSTLIHKTGIQKNVVKTIFKLLNISESTTISNLNKESRNKLVNYCCEFPLTIGKLGGLNQAMVTKGGVNLKEIDDKTMQSKIVDGLYFSGEVMDIDAKTGGFNLQAAFSTAYTAMKSIGSGRIL